MTDNSLDYASILVKGRQFLDNGEAQECAEFIVPILRHQESLDGFESAKSNGLLLEAVQLGGEALLELGNPQDAYQLLEKAVEADPTGERGGVEKFLWMGQLIGGRTGLTHYETGISILRRAINDFGNQRFNTNDVRFKRKKIADALCGMIEIWMTDLCMEPEAEQSCENLIADAMLVDPENPETWSVMGSIRISQQRNDDARSALVRSWDLYHDQLAESSNGNLASNGNSESMPKIQEQQQQLIPSLIRLAQNSVEMGLYRNVIEITAEIQRLDDQVAECYYLHGLSRAELYKQAKSEIESQTEPVEVQRLQREANKNAVRAREAWETLLKLVQEEPDLADPELGPTVMENLKEIPQDVKDEDYDSSDEEDGEEDVNIEDLE